MERAVGVFDTVDRRTVVALFVPVGEELIRLELAETELRRPFAVEVFLVGQARHFAGVADVIDIVVIFIFFGIDSTESVEQVIGERIRWSDDRQLRFNNVFSVLGVGSFIVNGVFPVGELGQRRLLLLLIEGPPLFAAGLRRLFDHFGRILIHLVLLGSTEGDVLLGGGAPFRCANGRPRGRRVGAPGRRNELFSIAVFCAALLKAKQTKPVGKS